MKNNYKICLFGTYLYNYSRNSTIRSGLKLNGVDVVEAHFAAPAERLDAPEDLGLYKTLRRVWNKTKASAALLGEYRKVKDSDAVLVLYPGHLILPVAWVLCVVCRKPLIFDSLISLSGSVVDDRGMAKKSSVKGRVLKFIEKILLHLPDKLLVDTGKSAEYISQEFHIDGGRIVVVPLAADDNLYQPAPQPRTPAAVTEVMFFGYYNPLQGAKYIAQAARLIADPQIHITMIGEGVFRKEVVDYAAAQGLSNISFLSNLPEKDLVRKIQQSDIMLGIFSNSIVAQRVLPNKVLAAIACKKPLISARLPAMLEYFADRKNVYFCEPENPASLAQAIIDLARNKALQHDLAAGGYELFQKKFSPKQISSALVAGVAGGGVAGAAPSNKATVTIGIPAYNEAGNIQALLGALLGQNRTNFDLKEIIVVSDGSTDQTVAKIQELNNHLVRVIEHHDRQGQASRQNEILAAFDSDVLVLLNADVLPANREFLSNLVQPFIDQSRIGIVGAKVSALPAAGFFENVIRYSHEFKTDVYESISDDNIYLCHGRARAFSREFAKQMEFKKQVGEDAYSYMACKTLGYKFAYSCDAVVLFRSPRTLADQLKQSIRFQQGRSKYISQISPAKDYYRIPNGLYLQKAIKYFLRNPVYFASYIFIFAWARMKSRSVAQVEATWSVSESSKTLK
jgi:glycosyltransferase involved in cell wall biosynthesis